MATDATNEHATEIKTDDAIKEVDEVSVTKALDNELKDDAAEPEKKPDTKETTTLVEEPKIDEVEDSKSDIKESVECEKSEETATGGTDSNDQESSKEDVESKEFDVLPVQDTETGAAKDPTVPETVTEEIKSVEQPPESSAGFETVSTEEEKTIDPVAISPTQESTSDDTKTPADSETTDIEEDKQATSTAVEVSSESTYEDPPVADKPEQTTENTIGQLGETIDSENPAATDPTEVYDTKEVTEVSVVTEVSDVATDATEVSGATDPDTSVPSNDLEEKEPAVAVELSADSTVIDNPEAIVEKDIKVDQEKQGDTLEVEKPPTISEVLDSDAPVASIASDNPEGIVEKDIKVEQEKQEDTLEVEKAPTISEVLHSDAPVASMASEAADAAETEAKELKIIPDLATNVLPASDEPDVVNESPIDEPHEKIQDEKTVAADDSTEVADVKEIIEKIVAEVPEVVEKTDDVASATVDSKEAAVNESVVATLPSVVIAHVTENPEAKLEEVVEVEKAKKEEAVESFEAVETATGDKIADAVDETKSSVSEALVGEKTDLVETTRELDITGVAEKATESEAKEVEAEVKPTEGKGTLLDKFSKETSESKKEEETVRAVDETIAETNTESADQKTDEQAPKDTVSKPSQRNIISKVKQSIVKVKKAIIGKSPSSKTIQTDAKEDTKAK